MAIIFDPPSGTYSYGTELKLTSSGNQLFYWSTGTIPGSKAKVYTVPIILDGDCTISALHYYDLQNPSELVSQTYVIEEPVLEVSLPDGTYYGAQIVTITTNYPKVYYTLNGTEPNESSAYFTTSPYSIQIHSTCILTLVVSDYNYNESITRYVYTIDTGTPPPPTVSTTVSTTDTQTAIIQAYINTAIAKLNTRRITTQEDLDSFLAALGSSSQDNLRADDGFNLNTDSGFNIGAIFTTVNSNTAANTQMALTITPNYTPQATYQQPIYIPIVYPVDQITTYSYYTKIVRQVPQSLPPYNLSVKEPTNWISNSAATDYNGICWQNRLAKQWYDVVDPKIWGCSNLSSEWGSPLQVIYDNNSFDYIRSESDFSTYFKIFTAKSIHIGSINTASAFHGKDYVYQDLPGENSWKPTKLRATWEPANLPLMIQGIDNDPYGPKYSGVEYDILTGNGYETAIIGLSIQATDYTTNFIINTIEMYGDDPAKYYQEGVDSICDVDIIIPPGTPTKALFRTSTLPHDFYNEDLTKIWSIQSLTIDKPINNVYFDSYCGISSGTAIEFTGGGNYREIRINPTRIDQHYAGDLNFYTTYPYGLLNNAQCILTLGTTSGRVMRWHMTIA